MSATIPMEQCVLEIVDVSDTNEVPIHALHWLAPTAATGWGSSLLRLRWNDGLSSEWSPTLFQVQAALSAVEGTSLLSGAVRLQLKGVEYPLVVGTPVILGCIPTASYKDFDVKVVPPSGVEGLECAKITFSPTMLPVQYGSGECFTVPIGGGVAPVTYSRELALMVVLQTVTANGGC